MTVKCCKRSRSVSVSTACSGRSCVVCRPTVLGVSFTDHRMIFDCWTVSRRSDCVGGCVVRVVLTGAAADVHHYVPSFSAAATCYSVPPAGGPVQVGARPASVAPRVSATSSSSSTLTGVVDGVSASPMMMTAVSQCQSAASRGHALAHHKDSAPTSTPTPTDDEPRGRDCHMKTELI